MHNGLQAVDRPPHISSVDSTLRLVDSRGGSIMGVSITEPLLGQKGLEEDEKLADHDDSYLETGLSVTEKEGLLQVRTVVNHGKSSFWQTTMNCLNLLLGMGLLALPLALEEGGWLSLVILLAFAIMCWYTGILLIRCLKRHPTMKSYQDIGEAACGSRGRVLVTTFMYLECAAYLVGNTISMGDNLSRLFPNARLNLPWLHMEPSQLLVIIAVMVILPTVWLRDMSSLSFVSVGGVVTSLIVMAATAWAGLFGGVGFTHSAPLLNIWNVPLVSGIYAFCYAGHLLLPSIYNGMENPDHFPQVMMVASIIASLIYGGTAVIGVTMFGKDTRSQITLNIPKNLTVATISLWTAVLTPLSKFALGLAPVSEHLEDLLPFERNSKTHWALGTAIRTILVFIVLVIALAVPFFHNMLALCGSSISLTMAVTLPPAFYLVIFRTSLSRTEVVGCVVCITTGIVFAVSGTETSLISLIEKLNVDGS